MERALLKQAASELQLPITSVRYVSEITEVWFLLIPPGGNSKHALKLQMSLCWVEWDSEANVSIVIGNLFGVGT